MCNLAHVFKKNHTYLIFFQISSLQVHTWSTDVNQFVADEDEGSFSCRISGKLSHYFQVKFICLCLVRDKIWSSYAYMYMQNL